MLQREVDLRFGDSRLNRGVPRPGALKAGLHLNLPGSNLRRVAEPNM